jgi:hypothetical protein
MAETRALVRFTERSYQALYEDFRIFIQGVDVTAWVSSSLTITRSNRDGPGTCNFTLDNAMDRFVLTSENLTEDKWRDTNDRYSEAAKHAIYLYKTGQSEVTQDRVAEMMKTLFDRNLDIVKAETGTAEARLLADATGKKRRGKRNRQRQRDVKRGKITDKSEAALAVSDTLQDLPADSFLSNESLARTEKAASDLLIEQGFTPASAELLAYEQVERRRRQITRAGKRRPAGDGKAQETNQDQRSAERYGRHKRVKNIRNPIDSDTGDSRWPLQQRSIVFHKNDPVRIFLHDPLTEADVWLFGFAGFIDAYPVQTDYLTGQSTIQIQCYDIKALMQKMRVQQNTLTGTQAPEPLFRNRSSIFADLISTNSDRLNHSFANMSFENSMALLTTGTTIDRRGQGRRFGIGDMSVGKVVTYPVTREPDDDQNRATLEEWHTLCLNGPASLTDENSIAETGRLTGQDVERIGRGTTSDGPYTPTRGFVHFLLPKAGTAAHNLTQTSFDTGSEQRDWVTRFEIVNDFCGRLDYEFTVLPNGDMAFEFPMYDFLPEDFGDYKSMFEADYHLISGNFADESSDIVTAVVVSGGPARTDQDELGNAPASVIPRGIIQSSVMAARVGLTVEQVSLPFVRTRGRLRSLGFIEFQKRLANANTIDMQFGFRPFFMPNRPVYNIHEKRMGLTSSVTDTMEVFGVCSTSAAVRFVRQVRADGTFRFITGSDSMPISYRKIFPGNVRSTGNAKAGVRTSLEEDGDEGALEDQTQVEATAQSTNDDKPPAFIDERRPGTFFTLTPTTRKVAEQLGQVFTDRPFLLTNTPEANGTTFGIRARGPDGGRIYSDAERETLALAARDADYILIDTRERFRFEPRRSGQPTFIVRRENA